MTFRASKYLLAAVTLAGAALSCSASAACSGPEYPKDALRRDEEGVTELAFLVRPDGTVERSAVEVSTGYPDLDQAARLALEKCVLKPATDHGEAITAWRLVNYIWTIGPTLDVARAQQIAAAAAQKGDPAALYRLSRLLSWKSRSNADHEKAFMLAKSAAEQGFAPAQFAMGLRYEKGDGVTASLEEAMRWYKRAAAQDDVFAVQRLRTGILPY
jgi:TonB family protein